MIKRYIAGAICPNCGQIDTIAMVYREGIKMIICHHCDYTTHSPGETDTLSTPSEIPSDDQVVQWFTPKGKKDPSTQH